VTTLGGKADDTNTHDQGVQELPEDFDRPAQKARAQEAITRDHPKADSDLDAHELYDEGLSGAAEVGPIHQSAVLSYDPTKAKKEDR
jgi:hypothetical protein